MEKKKAALLCAVTALVTAAACFCLLLIYCGGGEGLAMLKKQNEIRRIIDTEYVADCDIGALSDGAAAGQVAATGDRWSYYMNAEEYADYLEYTANSVTGIGVTVQAGENGFEIIAVEPDSPAQSAGIEAGELIVAIDGKSVEGMLLSELSAEIRGMEGEFQLTLRSADKGERSVTLSTAPVYRNPVSSELLDGGIGYINIRNFESGCAEGAISAVDGLIEEGARALVFDVRSNPGGLLSELMELLDHMLPEGDMFVSRDRTGAETVYTSDAQCVDCPAAVLINGDTYSAAEFFAAALSEYDRAVIVGEPSTGKSRSQITCVLDDGSAVHISGASYLTPNRVDLAEQGGLTPDVVIAPSAEGDAQLEAALKCLDSGE